MTVVTQVKPCWYMYHNGTPRPDAVWYLKVRTSINSTQSFLDYNVCEDCLSREVDLWDESEILAFYKISGAD
jgi:hypothetical protein